MTAQIREIIIINDEQHGMDSTPLEPYLNKLSKVQNFNFRTTACWRGYRGTWKLEHDQLYLVCLEGNKVDKASRTIIEVGMEYLFPGQQKVFANWFSGVIAVPHGEVLTYDYDNYLPSYEHTLHLTFDKGILIDFKSVDAMEKMVNDIQIKKLVRNLSFWERIQNLLVKF
ncbi:hypothetical protein [Maribacter antarcticus]|uniref:hypothetical protein n=1 Tax=Maribacter antarcticus TaxID=505250 RepID=UPI00047C2503|nr:hypothetical protein [Maribacter antarcticus]